MNGRMTEGSEQQSDNESDKKVITKDRYEMVCGWLVV